MRIIWTVAWFVLSLMALVVSEDIISTIVGTGTAGYSGDGYAATSATLNRPFAVTADPSGNY